MKILARDWVFPCLTVLILDCITSFYIWTNGGYDLNPIYAYHTQIKMTMAEILPFYLFTMFLTHVGLFFLNFWFSKRMPKYLDGLPFFTVFLIYVVVCANNILVIAGLI